MRIPAFFIKLSISVAIIWLVWDKVSIDQLRFVLTDPILLAIIPVCWFVNQIFTTLRLHSFLHALGRSIRLLDVFRANMSSLFVGNILPGVIGADVVKFVYLRKYDPSILKAQLAIVLALDRVLGLISVLLWCSFFSLFIDTHASRYESEVTYFFVHMPIVILVFLILGVSAFGVVITFCFRSKVPLCIRNFVDTYRELGLMRCKHLVALVMLYSLLAVFVLLLGLVIVGGELQLQQTGESMFALQFFLIPLALIASMLPLTPMGIGVAQITMASAYSLFGLDSSVGVSISTVSQLGLLFVSVTVGGVCFLFGGRDVNSLYEN